MEALIIMGSVFGIGIFIGWSIIVGAVNAAALGIAIHRCCKEDRERNKK